MRRAALLVFLLLLVPARAHAATITMSGSDTAEAVIADLAYFYHHADPTAPRFSLVGGGAGIGITDAYRGVVDAGMVSRNLGPSDPPGLVLTPFALSGVCLVTNRANPVPGLTRAQIQDIVAGRVTNWSQIPGSPRTDAIVPVALDVTAGSRQVFDSVFVDVDTPIVYQPRTFPLTTEARDFIAATPGAFGYLDLVVAQQVHAMTYDGVPCTRATIKSGAYPAQRPLGVVTKGPPRGALKRFLHWVGTSAKARQVISTHYLPTTVSPRR